MRLPGFRRRGHGRRRRIRVSEIPPLVHTRPLHGIGQNPGKGLDRQCKVLQGPYPRVSCLHLWRRHRWPAHLGGRRSRAGIAGDAHEADSDSMAGRSHRRLLSMGHRLEPHKGFLHTL